MTDLNKVKVVERNGVELDFEEEIELRALLIFLDNINFPGIDNISGALDFLQSSVGASASPGFSFGRAANVGAGTWLQITGGVPSNKTGIPVAINNPKLTLISVGNEDVSSFSIGIYEHDGGEVNLTLLTTVSVINSRTSNFDVLVLVTSGRQLAARLISGSAKNVGVSLQLKGNN